MKPNQPARHSPPMPKRSDNPSSRCASAQAEAHLIERIGKGCTRSFEELYRRYSGPLYSYALQSLNSTQDAEESIQDTFIRVWDKASQYRTEKAHPFTWIMMILRGNCIDILRKRNAKRRGQSVNFKAITSLLSMPRKPSRAFTSQRPPNK